MKQRSFLQLAFWALTMAKKSPKDKEAATHLLFFFVMDMGVSPFVKCYDDVALISGLIRSREFTLIELLLSHKFECVFYDEWSYFIRQISHSSDRYGNNILHEIYMQPESIRNVFLDILDQNPMEVHFRTEDEE